MKKLMLSALVVLVVPGLAAAWSPPPAPAGLVGVPIGGQVEMLWPYTGRNYSGMPTDPINIIFLGNADPRMIRQALFALDGDRTAFGFPNQFPFNCTWTDAIGTPQTSYSDRAGWEGGAVQLECGDYALLRTHLRLFRHGPYTLGGAHFEIQIPGTSSHEVLSWEVPESLVAVDMIRSGLAAPQFPTGPITDAPYYRTIRHQIFNQLPLPLRGALGLPIPDQQMPVPIPNDGLAQVFMVGGQLQHVASKVKIEFDHPFGQAIPKPFCSSGELLYVSGSVHMVHKVATNKRGRYVAYFRASGTLQVVPINIMGQPIGPPFAARVFEVHYSKLTNRRQEASFRSKQMLLTSPTQWLVEKLRSGRRPGYFIRETCGF